MQWPRGERPRSPISLSSSLPISRLSNPPRILSRPYFDLKAKLNQNLDDQKRQVEVIEETIAMTKRGYSDSLRELEKISEEIREMDELGDGQLFFGLPTVIRLTKSLSPSPDSFSNYL